MFTYIDPTVRQRLIADRKLRRIDAQGKLISAAEAPAAVAINVLGPIPLPIPIGPESIPVDWYVAVRHTELHEVEKLAAELRERGTQELFASLSSSMAVNSVLIIKGTENKGDPLVRVHSSCVTGDIFGSERCECGPQLDSALKKIRANPSGGVLIYMAGHEGRGIGLWAKAATYLLQDAGENTYQANESLGLPADSRDFADAAALLKHFVGHSSFGLLSNNPKKLHDLERYGLGQITLVKHVVGVSDWNRDYLEAKRDWGHRLAEDDLDSC